ncbi:MAG: CotH kinase family protein [Eubacteriales bacterium]|nr:CotH kinase family protein [Eubacteriales bacterium]
MIIADKIQKAVLLSVLSLLLVFLSACDVAVADSEGFPEIEAAEPLPEPTASVSPFEGMLVINELMVKNRATLTDEDGEFSDWIELHNVSDQTLELGGLTISDDDEHGWEFPAMTLAPDAYLLLFADGKDRVGTALHTDFSLSKGETVSLRDSGGALLDQAVCEKDTSDIAMKLTENGEWLAESFATPGYPNTDAGYEAWQDSLVCTSPLMITQVMTFNGSFNEVGEVSGKDWLLLKNVSGKEILLSDYCLSDDHKELDKFTLPDKKLYPGKIVLVICDDSADGTLANINTGFKLDSDGEELYLSENGRVLDYVFLHDIPAGCSFGRMPGRNGWFYFRAPSIHFEPQSAYRSISAPPTALTEDGVFSDSRPVRVELSGEGTIYYTLDGSYPTVDSAQYSGPFAVDSTCSVRAVAVQGNKMPSAALTLNYVIGEGHSLPVVCLNTDDPLQFQLMYNGAKKNIELPGSISLYEEHDRFTMPCGIDMHGGKSLEMKQKNMGIFFRSAYGREALEYDAFGGGVTAFNNFILRAGQDYNKSKIRNELFENLCMQYSDSVLAQRNRYCVLYINGEYWGIYSLTEKLNEAYYANLAGVSKNSVIVEKAPIIRDSLFDSEIIQFAKETDLSSDSGYLEFCERMDIDSLIDWLIIEGYSANMDLNLGNVRYCKSTEDDGKWRLMLYDLDSTIADSAACFSVLKRVETSYGPFVTRLLENEQFREKFLARAAEVFSTVLTDENVLAEIDRMCDQLAGEVERDFKNNNLEIRQWESSVENLKSLIVDFNWRNKCINAICSTLKVERADYFTDGEAS